MQGQVKVFSDYMGYGFVAGEDGHDYFIHFSFIVAEGFRSLNVGDTISFEPQDSPRGPQAHEVVLLHQEPGAAVLANESPHYSLKTNPFTPQDPVTDPHKFAGRVAVFANAVDALFNHKNILITGDRGIGKSSIA